MKAHRTLSFDANERNIFFIADPHLHHELVLKYEGKGIFKNTREHVEQFIKNWNSVITSNKDIVFVLGDFCFGTKTDHLELMSRLNGTKYFVIGNHDSSVYGNWQAVRNLYDIKIIDDTLPDKLQRLTLCHYPMLSWNQSHRGSWQLFGHVHGKLENKDIAEDGWTLKGKLSPRQLDVGSNIWNFTPVSWEQIKETIFKQIKNAKRNN